ncbi:MAG: GTPase domain-containing protein [Deltaproteobacteria bacterium]|nr:GTPase domain-containing protein [Deltaproteobacteria bacterium]
MKPDAIADDMKALEFSPRSVHTPGLIEEWEEISPLSESISVELQLLHIKKRVPALWVVLLGGTGTGKSTLFNALCGRHLSETGVERPKTGGPILYAHESCELQKNILFPEMEITTRPASDADSSPTSGLSGRLIVLEHNRKEFSHLILADTPDLDSVDLANRAVAENLYNLSDAVIFVASQEKYADEVPSLFLQRVLKEERLCYFILNKAQDLSTKEDILSLLKEGKGPLSSDRIWLLPYAKHHPSSALADDPSFHDFHALFLKELSLTQMPEIRKKIFSWHKKGLQNKLDRLTSLLEKEHKAAQEWLKSLNSLESRTSADFVSEQKKTFSSKNQDAIKGEIKRLFSKYDVLGRPRQWIRDTILSPLRFIGLAGKKDNRQYRQELHKVRDKIDLIPIRTAVEKFNHLVLEELSPAHEKAPLFGKLREPGTGLSHEEIKGLVWKAQDELDAWLEKRFEDLAASLPRTKRWGIYSTSILWGIMIVSLEVAVGGGFTILDALLGSALAPFVTKGSVELFAFHEIQKVTRELADRYRKGLLSVIHVQKERYERCLQSLLMPAEAKDALQKLRRHTADLRGE